MEKDIENYMLLALKEASSSPENEVPVGAVVVSPDGEIVGRGRNTREESLDISGHAEINAIKEAEKRLGRWSLEDCSLFVTLEPCPMCAGAIIQSRISKLYFGAYDLKNGAISSAFHMFDDPSLTSKPLVYGGILQNDCEELIKSFFKKIRM